MSSMLDAVRDLVTPDLVARMSAHTGDSEAAMSKGFGAAIPLLLSSLAGRADDKSFMSQLTSIAADTAGNADALRLPEALTGASGADTRTSTGRWLSSLFGSDLGGVIDGIARFAGLGKGSATSLLSMAAPIVLGYLGRLMRSDNLGAAGLADQLRSQSSAFASAVPAGLSSLLPSRDAVPMAAVAAAPSSRGWAVPVLAGILAIAGLMWWSGRHEIQPQKASVETQTSFTLPKPVGTSGTLPAEVIPSRSMDWAKFDRIVFINDSAALTPESRERIGSIAAALTAHPGAQISITGYTDSTGDEAANLALSHARANAVRDALRVQGISTRRIQIEGHGSQNPVASNDTEEGRAQNRRVMVEVTQR